MSEMKDRIYSRKFLTPFIGIILGVAGGFFYYRFIGCNNGSCAITSNPWLSMLWGAAVGYLLGDMFSGKKKEKQEKAA